MAKDEIQYGPNLKPKPGSQGTLFRGVKPVDEHRYQRGYTPERKRAVESAIRFVGPGKAVAQARDTIARSTVPLHNTIRLTIMPNGLPSVAQQPRATARLGEYKAGTQTIKQASPTRMDSPYSREARSSSLVHEYGHFMSDALKRPHSAYQTQTQQGQEEAFADNVRDVHYRPDQRNLRSGNPVAPPREMYGLNRPASFQQGYAAVRRPAGRTNEQPHPNQWPTAEQGSLW